MIEAISRRLALALVVLVTAAGLAGCSDAAVESPKASLNNESSNPKFSGPWSDVLKSAYEEASTEIERSALSDGVISDQEYLFFKNQIVDCLKGIGVEATWAGSTLDYTKPVNVAQSEIDNCNKKGGLKVIVLRDAMQRNPEAIDENEILVACLKRVDAVDGSYSASKLAAGVGIDKLLNTKHFDECVADPLNYGTGK